MGYPEFFSGFKKSRVKPAGVLEFFRGNSTRTEELAAFRSSTKGYRTVRQGSDAIIHAAFSSPGLSRYFSRGGFLRSRMRVPVSPHFAHANAGGFLVVPPLEINLCERREAIGACRRYGFLELTVSIHARAGCPAIRMQAQAAISLRLLQASSSAAAFFVRRVATLTPQGNASMIGARLASLSSTIATRASFRKRTWSLRTWSSSSLFLTQSSASWPGSRRKRICPSMLRN